MPKPAGRLPHRDGELIDRSKPVAFTFEGNRYAGYCGDSVASALAANGVTLLSRSFKYHRPRGILSLAGCEANTLIEVNGVPNVPAENHMISDGDRIRAQNYSGSLGFDWQASIGRLSRFLPVGFYYRAFFRPAGAWRFWEPKIRRMAGIGKVDVNAPHGYYDKCFLFADVAVVGGGAAGLSAAISAAETGSRVIVIDHDPRLGGALNYARFDAADLRAGKERDALLGRFAQLPNITAITGASCEGLFADNLLAVVKGRRLYKLRANRVVLATGVLEQPAVFRNNDLPGVMYGSAAQRLIKLYRVRPGTRAVILSSNDCGYGVALDLLDAGVDVAAIIELRDDPGGGQLATAAIRRNVRIERATAIVEALGRRHVRGVRVAPLRADGSRGSVSTTIDCDLMCMSVGFAPQLALAAQSGARLVYDSAARMYRSQGLPERVIVAGAANHRFEVEAAVTDGSAAARCGNPNSTSTSAENTHPYPIISHLNGKEFVDFDEDLTIKDITDTVASGFEHIELVKRYSTAGMGPSQGKHSAVNTVRIASRARGKIEAETGTTTARPPYSGVSFGVLAGRSTDPIRRTAMHHRHLEARAAMLPAGSWLRPAYYGSKGQAAEAIASELAAVRLRAGLIDVSTLGKIEIRGPQAGDFLDRLYVTAHARQPVGRVRYAVMTDATGAVFDDGVVGRLADTHFYVTATTTGVEAVVRSMYFWNAQWQLDVDISHVTAAYAAVNLAGPQSRAILVELCRDIDLSAERFPYLGVRTGHVAEIAARVLRVGFVGELGFEIHVPSSGGEYLWDRLLQAGERWGLQPFGVEAQRVLRLEKGHIIIGQDTDGLTTLPEIGMDSTRKSFFIGSAALAAHQQRGPARKLVGFTVEQPTAIPKECHLVLEGNEIAGHVTSCVHSATLGKVIGLAYVPPHRSAIGEQITIRVEDGKLVEGRVVALPFYDPGNLRQQM
jgi:sarcosine oxidase, subunit alpha